MKLIQATTLAVAVAPALAIPPADFGFPEAPNDTSLTVAFPQSGGGGNQYVALQDGDLFGIEVPQSTPILGVNTTAYQSLSNFSGQYLVLMVDPDASYPENPTNRFILHWLHPNLTQSTEVALDGITLTGQRLVNNSAALVDYARPRPPTNSSAHRYILYAFQQPDNFTIPEQWSGLSAQNRTRFNLTNFIADTNLGTPAAANYFYCSNQTGIPQNFTAPSGGEYPGGNGAAVTSGDPVATATGGGGASSSTSAAGVAMITAGMGSLVGAGLVGLAALM